MHTFLILRGFGNFVERRLIPGPHASVQWFSVKMNAVEEALLLYYYQMLCKKKKKPRKRRMWVHPIISERNTAGGNVLLYKNLREHPEKFFNYFRMSIRSFDELHNILKDKISKTDTVLRRSITSEERLMVTLR